MKTPSGNGAVVYSLITILQKMFSDDRVEPSNKVWSLKHNMHRLISKLSFQSQPTPTVKCQDSLAQCHTSSSLKMTVTLH